MQITFKQKSNNLAWGEKIGYFFEELFFEVLYSSSRKYLKICNFSELFWAIIYAFLKTDTIT